MALAQTSPSSLHHLAPFPPTPKPLPPPHHAMQILLPTATRSFPRMSLSATPAILRHAAKGLRFLPANANYLSDSSELGLLELAAGWRGVISSGHGGALSCRMNVFERVSRIFRSYIDSLVGSWEDPERMLDQAVEEMLTDLAKLRQTSAQVIAAKRLLEERYNRAQTASDDWYKRAAKFLERGDEALAREALKKRKAIEGTIKALKTQLDQQASVTDRVLSSSRMLENKINEARSKKDLLKARAQSAKTSKYVGEVVGSVDMSGALSTYQRMEEKVERLEAEADALAQISSDELSSKFAQLENDVDVEDDLKSLKKDILGGSFPYQIRGELPPWQSTLESNQGGRSQSSFKQ